MSCEFSTARPPNSSGPPAPLRVLCAPDLCVFCVDSDLFCFLSLTFLRNSCVHDRNALNSFGFKRVHTTFSTTEGWGMIPTLIPSPGPLVYPELRGVPVYFFQQLTTIKFCNTIVLITIQNDRGGGSPPLWFAHALANLHLYFQSVAGCSSRNLFFFRLLHCCPGVCGSPYEGVKVLLELWQSLSSQPSRENPTQQRAGSSWVFRSHQSRVTLLRLPLPHLSHSITTGRVPDACLRSIGENLE